MTQQHVYEKNNPDLGFVSRKCYIPQIVKRYSGTAGIISNILIKFKSNIMIWLVFKDLHSAS